MQKFLAWVFIIAVLGGFACAAVLFMQVSDLNEQAAQERRLVEQSKPKARVRTIQVYKSEDPYSAVTLPGDSN